MRRARCFVFARAVAMPLLLLPGLIGLSCSADQPAEVRSVVLISVDTLRADHLEPYGHTRSTSPFLSALARKSAVFADARSLVAWTLPSHASLLSGQHLLKHGVVEADRGLPEEMTLLAEEFLSHSYRTAGFVTGYWLSRRFGFEQGFERFEDFGLPDRPRQDRLENKPRAEEVVRLALDWIDSVEGQPFFLFLHFFDSHFDYRPPAPFDAYFDPATDLPGLDYKNYFYYLQRPLRPEQLEHQLAQYDESILYVDRQLHRLAVGLRRRGLRPLFVVTADHGEEFFERGSWGHAHTLSAEQLHVPLLVHSPGQIDARRVITAPVQLIDVAPTLLDLSGLPPNPAHDGLSLRPLLMGEPEAEEVFRVRPTLAFNARFETLLAAVQIGGEKLIADLRRAEVFRYETYADPGERKAISTDQDAQTARLRRLLIRLLSEALPGTTQIAWEAIPACELQLETSGVLIVPSTVVVGEATETALELHRKLNLELSGEGRLTVQVAPETASFSARLSSCDEEPKIYIGRSDEALGSDRFVKEAGVALEHLPPETIQERSLHLWLERGARASRAVFLSDEEKEVLEALGYLN